MRGPARRLLVRVRVRVRAGVGVGVRVRVNFARPPGERGAIWLAAPGWERLVRVSVRT